MEKSGNKLIGRFYFKQTSNGNLIGEFSNNKDTGIYTESADIPKGKIYETFAGIYISTWHAGNSQEVAKLKIESRPGTYNKIFSLTWTIDRIESFWGEAMLCDGILVGDYRNFK
jgi:hypothetical protein